MSSDAISPSLLRDDQTLRNNCVTVPWRRAGCRASPYRHPRRHAKVVPPVKVHWEIKGRFRKRVVLANVPSFQFSFRGNMRTYPRSGFHSGGPSECTLVPVFVPGDHPPKNHPFGKPPFWQPKKGSPILKCPIPHSCIAKKHLHDAESRSASLIPPSYEGPTPRLLGWTVHGEFKWTLLPVRSADARKSLLIDCLLIFVDCLFIVCLLIVCKLLLFGCKVLMFSCELAVNRQRIGSH